MLVLNLSCKDQVVYFCGGNRGKKTPFDFKDFSAVYYLESSGSQARIGFDFSNNFQVLREDVLLKDSNCNVDYLGKLLLKELLETGFINTRLLRILLRTSFYEKNLESCSEDTFIREINFLFDSLINSFLKSENIFPLLITSLSEENPVNSSIKNFKVVYRVICSFYFFFLEGRGF